MDSDATGRSPVASARGVSPVVGTVLLLAIVVMLGAVVGVLASGVTTEEDAPKAAFQVAVDTEDDAVRLVHHSGDRLHADRTRLVWTVDGERLQVDPADSSTPLRAGDEAVFVFDGTSTSRGTWDGYPSPGNVDIRAGDEIAVTMYDTETGKAVYEQQFEAGAKSEDFLAGSGGSGLLWLADDTAGATDVRFHVEFTVQPGSSTVGNSLDSVEIDMDDSSLTMFGGTTQADLVRAGVDTDGDGTTELDVQGDVDAWNVKEGGSRLKIGFGGSAYTNPQAGETIVVVFDGASAPSTPGTYGAEVQTSGDGNWQDGNVTVT